MRELKRSDYKAKVVEIDEMRNDAMLRELPAKFLLWQKGLILKRQLPAGAWLCKQGEAGNIAFRVKSGHVLMQKWKHKDGAPIRHGMPLDQQDYQPEKEGVPVLLGEMACLNGRPRAADLIMKSEGEVWELRRNVVDRLLNLPDSRKEVLSRYRRRALRDAVQSSKLFEDFAENELKKYIDAVRKLVGENYLRVRKHTVIFQQNEEADRIYFIRLGYIAITIRTDAGIVRTVRVGPGDVIGEMGLLMIDQSDVRDEEDLRKKRDFTAAFQRIDKIRADALESGELVNMPSKTYRRSGTAVALENVEMAWINRRDFLDLLKEHPDLRMRLVKKSVQQVCNDRHHTTHPASAVINQAGLYQGQSLLVIDSRRCTQCNLCTDACVEHHRERDNADREPGEPLREHSRLNRMGIPFGHFIVAKSCRSCYDAYCMQGCPVDAIHRGTHQQIVIEDHCIGCGLCASQCPYGSIAMYDFHQNSESPTHEDHVRCRVAINCDQCDADSLRPRESLPRCEAACPYDALHRIYGNTIGDLID